MSWAYPLYNTFISVTESPRRYISDEIVGGFTYVLSMSHLCPIYVLEDTADRLGVKGFINVLEGVYRKLILL